jgi:hypothetical protein
MAEKIECLSQRGTLTLESSVWNLLVVLQCKWLDAWEAKINVVRKRPRTEHTTAMPIQSFFLGCGDFHPLTTTTSMLLNESVSHIPGRASSDLKNTTISILSPLHNRRKSLSPNFMFAIKCTHHHFLVYHSIPCHRTSTVQHQPINQQRAM